MPIDDLPGMLLKTAQEHIPSSAAWVPFALLAGLAVVALLLMTKGARMAPGIAAVALAFAGGAAGSLLPPLIGTPFWPSVAVASTIGLILGILLFRLWLAVLVAGCLVVAALGVYGSQNLREPLNSYMSRGLDLQAQEVTLKAAGEVVAPGATPRAEILELWSYLCTSVPTFQSSFFLILIAAGVAGLVFALLLPYLARAFWAATLGTGLLLLATYGLVQSQWPAGMDWLNRWGLIAAIAVWSVSMIFNLADVHGVRLRKNAAATPKPAAT